MAGSEGNSSSGWVNACLPGLRPPQLLRSWLLDRGSLTARLQRLSHGALKVEVLRHGWARPDASERRALSLGSREAAIVREVILRGQGEAWVYARSVIPQQSLSGALGCLRHLDARPLGSWLFTQPDLRRDKLQLSRFVIADVRLAGMSEFVSGPHGGEELWGRRSVFRVGDKPLLVGEVFLPAFRKHLQMQRRCADVTVSDSVLEIRE